jgi:hypothetical protein
MAADNNPMSDRPAVESPGNPSKTPSSVAPLARRICDWTSKGIVTGVILVAGLAFGRQVLVWWGEGDQADRGTAGSTLPGDGLGDEAVEHEIRFGSQVWSMSRQAIAGAAPAANAALRKKCREVIASGWIDDSPPGPQERRLLASLAAKTPVEAEGGRWRVYQFDDAVPMVVGVRQTGARPNPPGGGRVAETDLRVVSWGFGVPDPAGGWTLYTFTGASPAGGSGEEPVSLPPGCTRTLSMRVAGGGAIVAFCGPRQPETWKACFDQSFRQRGWTPDGPWQARGERWFSRYREGSAPGAGATDVQFGPDDRGGLAGLLMVNPRAVQSTESKGL